MIMGEIKNNNGGEGEKDIGDEGCGRGRNRSVGCTIEIKRQCKTRNNLPHRLDGPCQCYTRRARLAC